MDENPIVADDYTIVLTYLGLYSYWGRTVNLAQRAAFLRWRANRHWPKRCEKCGIKVREGTAPASDTMTLDHIIPKFFIYELELPGLITDPRNLRMLCSKCNNRRGHDITDLPLVLQEKIRSLLKEAGREYLLDEGCKETG